jgi:hypothetical protein
MEFTIKIDGHRDNKSVEVEIRGIVDASQMVHALLGEYKTIAFGKMQEDLLQTLNRYFSSDCCSLHLGRWPRGAGLTSFINTYLIVSQAFIPPQGFTPNLGDKTRVGVAQSLEDIIFIDRITPYKEIDNLKFSLTKDGDRILISGTPNTYRSINELQDIVDRCGISQFMRDFQCYELKG